MADTPRPYTSIIDDLVEASKAHGRSETHGTMEDLLNDKADVAFYQRELIEYIEQLRDGAT